MADVTSHRGRNVCHGILAGRGSAVVASRTAGRITGGMEFRPQEGRVVGRI